MQLQALPDQKSKLRVSKIISWLFVYYTVEQNIVSFYCRTLPFYFKLDVISGPVIFSFFNHHQHFFLLFRILQSIATSLLVTWCSTANIMVNSAFAKNPTFQVYFNPIGWMLSNLTAGVSPVSNLGDALAQVALSGLFRLIMIFILNDWWITIRKFRGKEKKENKKKGDPKID
jgi:hypothetical protein